MSYNFNQKIGLIISFFLLIIPLISQAENKVKITKDLPYLDVQHNGKTIRIERNQDPDNQLTNSFSKTSRVCPPFCINPIELGEDIKTVGELELLSFLDDEVKNNKGLLIDSRMPEWFDKGTIPGAVNIPFTILTKGLESKHTVKILKLLGATQSGEKWDFKDARQLLFFCNGLWCGQSSIAIKNMVKLGYPEDRLFWYRGGMQAWQSLGLTIVAE